MMPGNSSPFFAVTLLEKWRDSQQRYPAAMTDLMRTIVERKRAQLKALAALPVGEILRILEQMIEATRVISATQPHKPANPLRISPP